MANLDELRLAKYVAENAERDVDQACRIKIQNLVEEYTSRVTREVIAEFAGRMTHARQLRVDAVKAWEEAVIADAEEGGRSKYPVGTVLKEWTNDAGEKWYRRTIPWELTGNSGVLEVVTPDFVHPGNLPDYSRADVGDVVLRLHKKNGEAGSKYVRHWQNQWRGCWLPEGEAPKA